MTAPHPAQAALPALLAGALVLVAAATLTPTGTGWAWGSPAAELRWYAAGLGSGATLVQLAGNLALLAVPAALIVLLRPGLGRPARLVPLALAAATAVELLQWALPLGRVVSPLDAVLNASGAVVAGLAAAAAARQAATSAGCGRRPSAGSGWCPRRSG